MKSKKFYLIGVFGFCLLAVGVMVFYLGKNLDIFASTTGSREICDNRIDDNGDGRTDDCWDPGKNYQPTGTIYYVSKASNASDSNSGTQASPFKTINKATSLARAGDGIYVSSGVYPEDVIFANAGTPTMPIILKGIGPTRDSVIIQKSRDWTSTGFIAIEPKSNTIIQNLSTDGVESVVGDHGYGGIGIYLNNVENILVQNCHMKIHEKPIKADKGSRLIVRDVLSEKSEYGFTIGVSNNNNNPGSEFADTFWENVEVREAIYRDNNDGWASEGSTTYHVFRNCKAHGWYDAGFDLKSHVLLENCVAYDNDEQGFKFWREAIVRNSIAYDNGVNNYLFAGVKPAGNYEYNYQMVGSISYGGRVLFEKTWETDSSLTPSKVKISHNIFSNTEVVDQVGNILSAADHNLFFGEEAPSPSGSSPKIADPKFKSAGTRDFHLLDGSPAIDSGATSITSNMSRLDFDNNNRKAGTAVDIGPYEYGSSGGGGAVTPTATLTAVRTPTITATRTATSTVTATATATRTATITPTRTATRTATATVTRTPGSGTLSFSPIGPQAVREGNRLAFDVSTTSRSTISATSKPAGSAFKSNRFTWWTNSSTIGSYSLNLTARNSSSNTATISIPIKVLKFAPYDDKRWLNVENVDGKLVKYQVCRRPIYTDKYTEVITFSDGSDYHYIEEAGRSACTNFYTHTYSPGKYLMTLYLCEKNNSSNCFPTEATKIN